MDEAIFEMPFNVPYCHFHGFVEPSMPVRVADSCICILNSCSLIRGDEESC